MAGKGRKRARARIPKSKRRNLKSWAEGARETVLSPHIEPYADSVEAGWRFEREYFRKVCNEFHAKIDWRLKDHEEPPLPLCEFDPKGRLPDLEELPEEEEKERADRMALLNARIRRWLKYRVNRLRKHVRTKLDSAKDPWAILLAKISGVTCPPKARQAFQQYMRDSYEAEGESPLEAEIKRRWANTAAEGASVATSKEPRAPFRAMVAREMFADLPADEREEYRTRAKNEAAAAREAYHKALNSPPSKSPRARQAAIDTLGSFIAPILQGIHDRTGLHSVILLGGPMPKYGGDLRTLHVSYGRNRTAAQSHFPQWDKPRWNGVLALMKEYLETVFTPQECTDAALPSGLEGAKYTMDSDHDTDSSSDSDDSNDDSEDSSDEEERPRKKQKKKGKKKAAKRRRGLADESEGEDEDEDEEVSSEEERPAKRKTARSKENVALAKAQEGERERQKNIARTRALLQPLVDGFAADKERWRAEDAAAAAPKKQAAPRKRKAQGDNTPATARKSRRLEQGAVPPASGEASGQTSASTNTAETLTTTQPDARVPTSTALTAPSSLPPGEERQAPDAPLPPTPNQMQTATQEPVTPPHMLTVTPPPTLEPHALPSNQTQTATTAPLPAQEPVTPPHTLAETPPSTQEPHAPVPPPSNQTQTAATAQEPVTPPQTLITTPPPTRESHAPVLPAPSAAPPSAQEPVTLPQTLIATPPPTREPHAPVLPAPSAAPPSAQEAHAPLPPPPHQTQTTPTALPAAQERAAPPNSDNQALTASPPPFEFAAEAPMWLRETVRVLSRVDLGCHYRSLVEALIRIEHRFGFDRNPQTGVGGTDRPAEIQLWIKAHRGIRRKASYDAGVVDLAAYAKRWWRWWDSLQPAWRKRRANGQWEMSAEYRKEWEWNELAFPGQNGCISVVASLYFWGTSRSALGGGGQWTGHARGEWDRAVQDAVWTLEGLEQTLPEVKKKGKGRVST